MASAAKVLGVALALQGRSEANQRLSQGRAERLGRLQALVSYSCSPDHQERGEGFPLLRPIEAPSKAPQFRQLQLQH